ncbi:MAG: IS1634 family transposase [Chamaesiphon sp. CSU_1_12]|nr:IS1634 family transposase [Chamaesiphon sp. CSU_1_12]
MKLKLEEIEIKNLDHLGIVAGIIDEIGIVEKVNELLGTDVRENINCGEVVKAIILNGLGFVAQPLYLFPNFFKDKAVEHLLGKGITASELNDDKLGRVMDKLYKYGLNNLFLTLGLEVIREYNVSTKYSHLDSTSFHLHGRYENRNKEETEEQKLEVNRENPIFITEGYSRDHRQDLKQCVLDLIVSSDGDIPIFIRGGSGNESDKAMFGKILVEYSKQVDFESIMIADSALYSAKNLIIIKELKWISRVPLSIKRAKYLVKTVKREELKDSGIKGYRYLESKVIYGGIEQRWMLVESEERKKSDLNKIINRIEKECEQVKRKIAKTIQQEFEQESLAMKEIETIQISLKYHQLVEIGIVSQLNKKGKEIYKVVCKISEDQEMVDDIKNQAGRFILATNILSEAELGASEILDAYKNQQSSERGFRFLKDPLFFADSLFVKNPERVETMMMLMGLSLLVYTIGQREIRNNLKVGKSSVKNQLNKLTEKPTMRWIFQCFQGIHYLKLDGIERISNLSEERCRILGFLPLGCQKYYLAT